MATLTDIALNDPPAVEALARNPLSLVGTAADPTGTAAATAAADEAAITAFYGDVAPFRTATRNALKGIYADQERLLREQRVGMTKGERLLETLAAFGQPVSGGMGEALANAARATTARNQSEREADRARKDKLAELMLSQRLEIAKSDASFGKQALELRLEQQKAKTKANEPTFLGVGKDDNGPYSQWRMPDGKIIIQQGEGLLPPVVPQSSLATSTVPPPKGAATTPAAQALATDAAATSAAQPPPKGAAAATPAAQAARPAGLPPEAYKGPDNAWYIPTYYGPKKVTEASPEDLANTEALKKGATLRAETRVKAVAALPKLNEFATSALEDVRSLTQHPGLSSISGINFDIWNRLGNVNETDEQTGRVTIRPNVVPGSKAAGALTLYDKIKGGTFVTGFQETFKGTGAGAFSNIEGNKTEINQAAIDLRQSDAEFIKNANIYSASIIRDARLAQWAAGVPMTFGLPPRNPAALKLGTVYLTATDKPLVVKRDAKTGAPVLDWLNEEDRPKKAK
jgi:hypothetical protein